MSRVAVEVEAIARPVVEENGMELVDVQYVKEKGRWYLRVFIDKPGGVTVDDCQLISEKLDPILDARDPIPHAYVLEVSSPGIERPLKKLSHFQRFEGSKVLLTTYVPIEGRRRFKGRLGPATASMVVVEVDGREVVIPMDQVASARLVAEF